MSNLKPPTGPNPDLSSLVISGRVRLRLVLPGLIWLQFNSRAAPAQIKNIDLERGNLAWGDNLP